MQISWWYYHLWSHLSAACCYSSEWITICWSSHIKNWECKNTLKGWPRSQVMRGLLQSFINLQINKVLVHPSILQLQSQVFSYSALKLDVLKKLICETVYIIRIQRMWRLPLKHVENFVQSWWSHKLWRKVIAGAKSSCSSNNEMGDLRSASTKLQYNWELRLLFSYRNPFIFFIENKFLFCECIRQFKTICNLERFGKKINTKQYPEKIPDDILTSGHW